MKIRRLAAVTLGLTLLLLGCSSSDQDASAPSTTEARPSTTEASTTTVAAPETSEGGPTTVDRPPPSTIAGQVYPPEVCATLLGALRAVTLPVEGTTGYADQLDQALAAVDAAAAAAPGYPAEQLDLLSAQLEDARPAIEDQGFYGWQLAIVEHRDGPDEQDIEVQLENFRQYVVPRC